MGSCRRRGEKWKAASLPWLNLRGMMNKRNGDSRNSKNPAGELNHALPTRAFEIVDRLSEVLKLLCKQLFGLFDALFVVFLLFINQGLRRFERRVERGLLITVAFGQARVQF